MDFSLLSTLEFFVFRKMEMGETINHPLCGCESKVLQKNTFPYTIKLFRLYCRKERYFMAKKEYSLAHTKWMCKYHIVFTPKYRRQIIYKQITADIGQIIRTLCARKGIEIIEAAAMSDHIHLYVSIPPKYSVSEIVGYLKGKSSLMIFDRHANLKYMYGNIHFWCRGYYVDTVGRNAKAIAEYVRN